MLLGAVWPQAIFGYGYKLRLSRKAAPNPNRLIQNAEKHIEWGRTAEAHKALLAAAAALEPGHPQRVRLHVRLGATLLAEGYTLTAKDSFIKALRLARNVPAEPSLLADAHLGMGLCLVREDNWPWAVKFFRKALTLRPSLRTRQIAEIYIDLSKTRGSGRQLHAGKW